MTEPDPLLELLRQHRREDEERRKHDRERTSDALTLAMARAQLAQAKRRGYRDAAKRYG